MNASKSTKAPKGALKRAAKIGKKLQGVAGCSIPGTHDKLAECRYFLGKMLETYHSPDEFRWNLHAFLQAVNSFVTIGLQETQNESVFEDFRKALNGLKDDEAWHKLSKLRNDVVHKEPLLANSSMNIGMYRGDRFKLGFQIPVPTHVPSWLAITKSRNSMIFVSAHRGDIGEEIGLERMWRLPGIDEEVAEFCIGILAKCGHVMRLALGHEKTEDICEGVDFLSSRMMYEHELFPEIFSTWEGDLGWEMTAKTDTEIKALPEESADILHSIPAGSRIVAWLGQGRTWNGVYRSLLIYSINKEEIREKTAGFYVESEFDVQPSAESPYANYEEQ